MTDEDLVFRIKRIYAAIGAMEERDFSKLPGEVTIADGQLHVFQDFTGGRKPEDISNDAHIVIHNLNGLRDHLKTWARRNGKDPSVVEQTYKSSKSLSLIGKLCDVEKHGKKSRSGSRPDENLKLVNLNCVMSLSTGGPDGSVIAMTFGADGRPVVRGGAAKMIITGDIQDEDGAKVGEFHHVAHAAEAECTNLAKRLGALP